MARITRLLTRVAPLFALCAAVLVGEAARAQQPDTLLFTTRVAPNVMFILDNSGSMNNVVWHAAYRQGSIYNTTTCPYVADTSSPSYNPLCLQYDVCNITTSDDLLGTEGSWSGEEYNLDWDDDGGTITRCGNTRELYPDPEVDAVERDTAWELNYLRWYFSDNADAVYSDIVSTNNGSTSSCLGAVTTFGLYRRARVTAAKDVTNQVICETSAVAELRYGLAKFYDGSDPQGGYVVVPMANYTAAHGTTMRNAINQIEGESMTPLSETLYNVYRYFMLRGATSSNRPWGKTGSAGGERFPLYDLQTDGDVSSSDIPPTPVTDTCQKHFVVLITDGEPTRDDHDDPGSGTDYLKPDRSTWEDDLIGDFYLPGDECERGCTGFGSEESRYLDDVAYFMHTQDFLPTTSHAGTQTLDVYTVGFTTNAVANDILNRAAQRGGGEFYSSNSPQELVDSITNSLASIVAKSQAFTSAAVPASRTTSGDNFYSAFFVPVLDSPMWAGHLKNFDFSPSGEVLTPGGFCAIGVDPVATPPCAASGALRTSAEGYWDAAMAMPNPPTTRKLYVELKTTNFWDQPSALLTPLTAGDQTTQGPTLAGVNYFNVVAADHLVNPYLPLTNDVNVMASALSRYLRGCTFSNGPACTARVDGASQPEYLGDIFHSNPLVVGSPNSAINESTYQTFATTYRTRPRVVYAGANDGWLHAFQAGLWSTALSPDGHTRGSGQELMGFMPYGIRKTIKGYVKHQSGLRTTVAVDGSPIAADVWFNRTGTGLPTKVAALSTKSADQWRTVLIQGLRDGGQSYHALDITDPPDAVGTTTTTYPRYLWGFPVEDAIDGDNPGTDSEKLQMGNSWSEPVITRVRVKVAGNANTAGFERWVAVFGAGYNAASDPNSGTYSATSRLGRAIYMVDISTGEVLAKKYYISSGGSLSAITNERKDLLDLRYAFPSAPAVFDTDFDGFADVIYIGDAGGNLWKWVVKNAGFDPILGGSYTAGTEIATGTTPMDQPNWPFRLFFRGDHSTATSNALPPEMTGSAFATAHYQSFFFPPTGVLRQNKLVLAFGSGERATPIGPVSAMTDGCPGTASACLNNNHFYVVKDDDPLERVGTMPNRITGRYTEANLLNPDSATPPTCAALTAAVGYMITARDGEKFVSNSTIFLGTVFTGSFLPNSTATGCDSKGTAYLYGFDLDCGVGEFPGAGDNEADRRLAVGSGLPTRPRVSVGDLNQGGGGGCPSPPCCINKIVVVTSDGEIYNDCPDDLPTSGVKVRSWRER